MLSFSDLSPCTAYDGKGRKHKYAHMNPGHSCAKREELHSNQCESSLALLLQTSSPTSHPAPGQILTFSRTYKPTYEPDSASACAQSWFRQKVAQPRRWAVFRVCRAGLVLCVAAAAAFVPGFGFFISLIGSLACSVLSFVIPAMSHLALFRESMPRWETTTDNVVASTLLPYSPLDSWLPSNSCMRGSGSCAHCIISLAARALV